MSAELRATAEQLQVLAIYHPMQVLRPILATQRLDANMRLIVARLTTCLGCRIASCMILKLFLMWVIGNYASGDAEFPVWKGWAIAAGLGGTGYVMTLLHHQIFWYASFQNLDSAVLHPCPGIHNV